MTIAAVIPFRGADSGKSRLDPYLAPIQRARLNLYLLGRVISAVADVPTVTRIAIVTPDTDSAELSTFGRSADIIGDGATGINDAVAIGQSWAASQRAEQLLVLPADLPLIRASHINRLLDSMPARPGGAVARSKDGGTAALLLDPPQLIEPAFGLQSATIHMQRLADTNAASILVHITGLAQDIDIPSDLDLIDGTLLSAIFTEASAAI